MPKGIGTYGSKRGRPPKMSTKKAMKKMGSKKKKKKWLAFVHCWIVIAYYMIMDYFCIFFTTCICIHA